VKIYGKVHELFVKGTGTKHLKEAASGSGFSDRIRQKGPDPTGSRSSALHFSTVREKNRLKNSPFQQLKLNQHSFAADATRAPEGEDIFRVLPYCSERCMTWKKTNFLLNTGTKIYFVLPC
jgi:hypothetical protein